MIILCKITSVFSPVFSSLRSFCHSFWATTCKRIALALLVLSSYGTFAWLASGPTEYPLHFQLHAQATGPKNIILFIGDGMGYAQVKAASLYAYGEEGQLVMESAPFRASMTTNELNGHITDSAASGTAMATGHKVANGIISLGGDAGDQEYETSLEHYQNRCKSSGLVVTSQMNHATPAVFAAHTQSRVQLVDIAHDFFTQSRPNILYGGGTTGITQELATENGYTAVTDRASMLAVEPAGEVFVSGQFSNSHLGYEYDDMMQGATFYEAQPHLSEMTAHAIRLLEADDDGFFLMVEGSRIDHAGHENNLARMIEETLEFDQAIAETLAWAEGRDDTLIVVTADHETGGLIVAQNNGQGNYPTVTWSTLSHTSQVVPVFGWGPNAEMITGLIDNTDIYRITTANSGTEPEACIPSEESDNDQQPGVVTPTPIITEEPTALPPTPTSTPTLVPTSTSTPTPVPPLTIKVSNQPKAWIPPGGELTYKIEYQVGAEKLANVMLHSRVPEKVMLVNESIDQGGALSVNVRQTRSGTAIGSASVIEWALGDLDAWSSGSTAFRVLRPALDAVEASDRLEIVQDGPSSATAGMPITYTLTLTNHTLAPLTDIFVVDRIPHGATYLAGAQAFPVDGELSWWLERIESGSAQTISYSVTAQRSVMTGPYRVYTHGDLSTMRNSAIVTEVNQRPLPPDGDGEIIINDSTWISWSRQGVTQERRSNPVQNPTYDTFLPYSSQ